MGSPFLEKTAGLCFRKLSKKNALVVMAKVEHKAIEHTAFS